MKMLIINRLYLCTDSLLQNKESPRGVVPNQLNCNIFVCEFELNSSY